MIKLSYLKGKFSQLVFFCFVAYGLSYFVPALIPDASVKRDRRIHISARRINGAKYVEGEVLVRFRPRVSRNAVDSVAKSNFSTVARRYNALTKIDAREYAHLKSKHRTTQQMIQALKKNPQVEAVSPNFFLHVDSKIPDDENFDYLWGLHNTGQMGGPSGIDIDAPEAWDITTGSSSVIVGVIDTGIDYNHPDLIPNIWVNPGEVVDGIDNDGNGYIDDINGINAIVSSGDPMDDHSHGTHCAGTIGAVGNNNLGVAGVNWNAKLIGTKFLDATGYGTDADAIECINYLIDLKTTRGQNIVAANASFGGGDYDPVMESAITNMGSAGIVFCAAAGNDWMDNDTIPHYPSSYSCSNIIAVTAVDWMGWQNFNYGATSVDLGAPGVDILSTISAVYYPQAGDIFFDDMESGPGNWVTGGTNNSWGITTDQEIFAYPPNPVPSPPNFWSDSPGADYLPDTDSWLMNASDIDLSAYVGQNLYLGFGSAMLLEQGAPVDHGYVEVSGDGGGTWQSLMDFAQYGYYWYIPWYFLIPDSVKTANFRFRFHLVTDFSIEYDGWLIDDVGIGTASYFGYGFKSGTSMATPHVTGAVALIAAQYSSETVVARINRVLNNVTPLPSLIDTCVTEGMLNLYAALTAGVEEYALNISATTGGTTNPVSGTYQHTIGTVVDVSANADTGYIFSLWTGDVPLGHEYENPVTITMNTDKSITANFAPEIIQYTLDISATAGGTTNPSTGIYSYASGADVLINALPNGGYKFLNWTGDVPIGHEIDNPLTITMSSDKAIIANFFQENDFNGDGQGDILWRHYGDGRNVVWYMGYSGGGMTGLSLENFGMMDMGQDLGQAKIYQDPMEVGGLLYKSVERVYWSPMEAGDLIYQREEFEFDWEDLGDAKEIRVLTGPGDVEDLEVRIQGLAIIETASLSTVTDTNWHIVGTGDFNGDGKVDILWRNYADGRNLVWYMNGVSSIGWASLSTVTDTNWQIVGTGDFNGDGKVDILWRNYADGWNVVWYMNGVSSIGWASLSTVTDTNWQIVGTGDFNGDGKVDILWRNYADGRNVVWYMNGVSSIGWASLSMVTDTNWKIENH